MCAYNISVVRDPLWPLSSIGCGLWPSSGGLPVLCLRDARDGVGDAELILSGPDSATAVFLVVRLPGGGMLSKECTPHSRFFSPRGSERPREPTPHT